MRLDILISTMHGGGKDFIERVSSIPEEIGVRVVNQIPGEDRSEELSAEVFNRAVNFSCINVAEKGLSKSRNKVIGLAEANIALISDDDFIHLPETYANIIGSFKEHKDADVLVFQQQLPDGRLRKKYSTRVSQKNKFNILGVTSGEIAFKVDSIKKNNIKFDELFGLGAKYPLGEEAIFLADCLQAGLKVLYIPKPIVEHDEDSTGLLFDVESFKYRGAIFKRIYGVAAIFLGPLFCFKKYRFFKGESPTLKVIQSFFSGYFEYKN